MNSRVSMLALALSVFLPGALAFQPPAPPPKAEAPAKAPAKAEKDPLPTVTLLEAGQGPRRALRYTPKAGLVQTVAMTMTLDQEQEMNGQAIPGRTTPPMKVTMELRVVEAPAAGGFRYTATVTKCDALDREGVPPAVKDAVQKAIDGMKGMEISVTSTDRALVTDASMKMPEGANPMLRQTMASMEQSMKQFATPVPVEEVGVGARWEVRSAPSVMGMRTDLKMVYTIESMEGGTARLRVDQVQTNQPGPVAFPGLPQGVTVEIVSGETKSTGELTIDTARILPSKGAVKGEGATEMSIDQNGQKAPMKTRTHVKMEMEG